jgi:hypothetical protein
MLLGLVIYCTGFALIWTWTLVWILERKDKTFRQGTASFTDAFLSGAFSLVFVFISNIVILLRWPRSALLYDLLLVTGLAGFGLYRETLYKARAGFRRRTLRGEARALELNIVKDPSNGAYYERLSEVYEQLGEKGNAIETAKLAAKLDPSIRNGLRVKHLEEDRSARR